MEETGKNNPTKIMDKQKGTLRQPHKTISKHFSASALYTESLWPC